MLNTLPSKMFLNMRWILNPRTQQEVVSGVSFSTKEEQEGRNDFATANDIFTSIFNKYVLSKNGTLGEIQVKSAVDETDKSVYMDVMATSNTVLIDLVNLDDQEKVSTIPKGDLLEKRFIPIPQAEKGKQFCFVLVL